MAAAKIQLTLDPAEFDLLRETLVEARDEAFQATKDSTIPAGERAQLRERSARLADLLGHLQ